MMKQGIFEIVENTRIARAVYEMKLVGDTSAITAPGQFVNILIDGLFLRRPISVCSWNSEGMTLVYKVVGRGTEVLSGMTAGELDILSGLGNGYNTELCGDSPLLIGGGVGVPPLYGLAVRLAESMTAGELDILSGLGNGYNTELCGDSPLLIGGGVGVPPLYGLAVRLAEKLVKCSVILGFNTAEDVFYEDRFKALGCNVTVTTVDGSHGTKGFVTDAMPDVYTYFYTCGPLPMLRAVCGLAKTSGEVSFEERMGCGFGMCMGCPRKTTDGYKRICKEGPVLKKEEILWEG